MHYRNAKAKGIAKHLLLGYKDVIFGDHRPVGTIVRHRSDGWNWHLNFNRKVCGYDTYFVHGLSVLTKNNVAIGLFNNLLSTPSAARLISTKE